MENKIIIRNYTNLGEKEILKYIMKIDSSQMLGIFFEKNMIKHYADFSNYIISFWQKRKKKYYEIYYRKDFF